MLPGAMIGVYRVFGYLAFLVTFSALILAATGLGLVPPIARPQSLPTAAAVALDLALVFFLGLQHTVMARPAFKRRVPARTERTTFVVASSACVAAIAFGWAPIDGDVWLLHGPAAWSMTALAFAGFGLAAASTFAFDHGDLFGLREPRTVTPTFAVPALYRLVRHPMMLGMLVGFWATPHMTVGHALFAAALTAYILVGVRYEERDLLRTFGDDYARYKERVPSLLPWPR